MDKNNKKLLKEEIERHNQILEYNLFIPDSKDLNEDDDEFDEEEDIDSMETPDMGNDNGPLDGEEGSEFDDGQEAPQGEPEMGGDEELPEPEGEINAPETEEAPVDDSTDDEIELDVTDIVNKSEAAKQSSDEANSKIGEIMSKLGELESKLPNMEKISKEIENLQKDIERRNPTEVEKLEMRSMNSYPYNLKLTDYWNDENQDDDGYEITNGENQEFENKDKEYVLTKDDVEDSYTENSIKDTF